MEWKLFLYNIASEQLIFMVKIPSKLSQDELLVFKYIEGQSYERKPLKFRYSEKATKIRKRIPFYFDVTK